MSPVLGVEEEYGGLIMQIRQGLFPVINCSGRNSFSRHSEIGRDAEDRVVPTRVQDGLQQFLVPIWRFNEDLGLVASNGVFFQLNQLFGTPVGLHWQVTVKHEPLTIQSGGHQREQYRRGPDQWPYPDIFLVSEPH